MKKSFFAVVALVMALGLSSCKTIIPVAVNSSAIISENNYEYLGEVRGTVKAVGNAKNFNGALTEMYRNANFQDGEAVINIDYVAIQNRLTGSVTLVATGQKIRYKK